MPWQRQLQQQPSQRQGWQGAEGTGALGASPVPKPKPSKHTGFLSNQANVGVTGGVDRLAKMIVSLLVKLERVAAGI